jgi:hypothetical protein
MTSAQGPREITIDLFGVRALLHAPTTELLAAVVSRLPPPEPSPISPGTPAGWPGKVARWCCRDDP